VLTAADVDRPAADEYGIEIKVEVSVTKTAINRLRDFISRTCFSPASRRVVLGEIV
jgi:hypothetical protein